MIEALEALGLPSPIASFLAQLPGPYLVVIISVFIIVKYLLLPLGRKSVNGLIEEAQNTIKNFNTKLESIENKLDQQNTRAETIQLMITELGEDSVGSTDIELALSTFAHILDKAHLRAYMHFIHRCNVNHYLGNEALIQGRYANKSSELAGKIQGQLAKYHYQGVPLSIYFKDGGAESYMRHLNAELCDLQGLKAHKDVLGESITGEDVQSGLDRLLSRQMGMFKEWLDSSMSDSKIYMAIKPPVKIIQEAQGDVDFL